MKSIAIGIAGVVALMGSALIDGAVIDQAFAADIATKMPLKAPPPPPAPSYSWTGPYLGIGLGARWSDVDASLTSATAGGADILAGGCVATAAPVIFSGCDNGRSLNSAAFRGSVYGGWNWQVAPAFVVGIEGDAGWADRTKTLTGSAYPATLAFGGFAFATSQNDSFAVKTTWDASARLRAGWLATPSTLLYVTGGVAWLHVESTSTCSTIPQPNVVANCGAGNFNGGTLGPSVLTHSGTKSGWTLGGGAETKLWNSNWIARAEYRFADYGTIHETDIRNCPGGCGGAPVIVSYDLHAKTHTALVGLAYKFDWGH